MRLPENKSDRQKVLALIALGVAAVAYALWAGVVAPLRQGRDESMKKVAELEVEMRTSRAQVSRLAEMQRDLAETMRNLSERSERDMLHPRLGNYLLQAREILMRQGSAAGAENIAVAEIGLVDPPNPPKAAPASAGDSPKAAKAAKVAKAYAVKAYSVRVTAECGTDAFVHWVRALEEENPLVALSQFTLAAQPDDPQRHQVRFDVQWPVWSDPGMRETVRQQAADVREGQAR